MLIFINLTCIFRHLVIELVNINT